MFAAFEGKVFESRAARVSLFFLLGVCLLAVFAPLVTKMSFEVQNIDRVLLPPNRLNFFGTDSLGRDLFSRVIYGARVSLAVALTTSLIGLFWGIVWGGVAGSHAGIIDSVMMRFVDIFQAIPPLVLMILISVVLESAKILENEEIRSIIGIMTALSLVAWLGTARLVRGQVLQLREYPFVEAARASGASSTRIFFQHILPNMSGPLLVMLTLQLPSQVLYESFLSFMGLGLQPPYSSWGVLANEGWRSFRSYPHLLFFPGAVLFLTMFAFNRIGDELRDALDPKTNYRNA